MHIGVVHTIDSPCGCAEAVSVGLKTLGHEVTIANSDEIEFKASDLARDCDLVIDHTDTFRGRGLYRAFVRLMLEGHGARLVGSGAHACFAADDKIVSKACFAKAGISTPPGIVIRSKQWKLPSWLRLPLVLKPVFEHMSRGVVVAETIREAYSKTDDMLDNFRQPIIVESYIPGKRACSFCPGRARRTRSSSAIRMETGQTKLWVSHRGFQVGRACWGETRCSKGIHVR